MLRIRSFQAITPSPEQAARVSSPPYDVVSRAEARALAAGNADSFLHVIRSEIDLPEDVPPDDQRVYDRARQSFQDLLERGVLTRQTQPGMYLYRQVLNHRPQVGLVCCCHVDDYAAGVIKRHEKTRPDKEDDRTRHVLAVNANTGPVLLAYRDDAAIGRIMVDDMNERPVFHFNAPDGVTHSAWTAQDPARYVEAFGRLPAAYVADGHHRAASAARAGQERRAADPQPSDDKEYSWFLVALFPASDLNILAYNRVVSDLGGRTVDEVAAALETVGAMTPTEDREPREPGRFCIYLGGRWHQLTLDPESIDRTDPIRCLDVDLLQQRVLGPVLGIGDPRTDPRIDFVGGIRGPQELERRVDRGEAALAVSVYPTSIEQLLEVADAGLIMPPKSTWFEPKLRSGLFVHSLD
jgi:uncharacterized protein (DUF1015 family)